MTRSSVLNPEVKQFLDEFNEWAKDLPKEIPPAMGRPLYEELSMRQAGVPLKIARVEDFTIPNQAGDYQIPLRVYTPVLHTACPGLLYLHGGGWQQGSLNTHDSICRNLAIKGQCIVVSVEWRLAPEFQFPIGLYDALDSYHWLLNHALAYNIDPKRIAIGGDSAGGNLAAALTLLLKEKALPMPLFQMLFYPALDLTCSTPSYVTYAEDYLLTTELVKQFVKLYLKKPEEVTNPLVSPYFADDLTGLPPTYIITAGFDPLRDEAKRFAHKLESFGVSAVYRCYESMIHGFLHMTALVAEVNTIFDEIATLLKKAFAASNQKH